MARTANRDQLWILADQAVSSVTNFLLIIFAARTLSATDLGRFSILLSLYYVALGLSQAIGGEVFLVKRLPERAPKDVERGLGVILLLSIPAAASVVVICGLADLGIRAGAVLAAFIPLLLLQDALRFVAFSSGTAARALISDAAWLALLIVGYLVVRSSADATLITGVWAVSGGASAVLLLAISHIRPSKDRLMLFWRRHGTAARHLVAEAALVLGGAQALLYATAVVVGLADAAALRATITLFGPLNVAFGALRVGTIRRLQSRPNREMPRSAMTASAMLIGLTACYVGILIACPDRIGTELFGDSWASASRLIALYGLLYLVLAGSFGPFCLLRALAATRSSVMARLVTAVLTIVGSVSGAVIAGTKGGVVASILAALVGLSLLGVLAYRALRLGEVGSPSGLDALVALEP